MAKTEKQKILAEFERVMEYMTMVNVKAMTRNNNNTTSKIEEQKEWQIIKYWDKFKLVNWIDMNLHVKMYNVHLGVTCNAKSNCTYVQPMELSFY